MYSTVQIIIYSIEKKHYQINNNLNPTLMAYIFHSFTSSAYVKLLFIKGVK